ncbi:glucose-6-phosphate dehydrogenase assembly protein OpcA [Nocardioides daphniae]|uniref:Glucose-6-phosphate dehydrogenase assembly protein OpcA n=1 Tax=Nocardioides daphniae TaxID=402297 RepID=A0ABQ1QFN5_9ACTN|nr:glucose-6-phosphate dehydrogenase assembly protein OpcA [Nocardioides daphniae]GGD26146.1 glucose-6-phosphate dehydrogenase assembly protein OpcA [Nocardioides daphniae]
MKKLEETNAAAIAAEFLRARRKAGSPAMGMVLTLVVVAPEDEAEEAMDVARAAAHDHPARILGVVLGDGRGRAHIEAEVGTGAGHPGETALIRLRGAVVKHAESVVLPLLLPDSPVVVWWWGDVGPDDPSSDPLGRLATRRITDLGTEASPRSKAAQRRYAHYAPGDTDFAWTRLTLWRATLAAVLDQHPAKVTAVRVSSERGHPSAALLRAWLSHCLKLDVELVASEGPAVTEVMLETVQGPITISRPDGREASLATPGRPERPVSLRIRELPELLSEELQHLDADEIYELTIQKLLDLEGAS